MANEDQVKILKRGVGVWNEWRENNPGIRPDQEGAHLEGAYLGGANLREAILEGADLRKAVFNGTHLESVTLTGAVGLHECIHEGHSHFNAETLRKNDLPYTFLVGIGALKQGRAAFGDRLTRTIEFPPEYYQAGFSILG